jgi:hypothetical protein
VIRRSIFAKSLTVLLVASFFCAKVCGQDGGTIWNGWSAYVKSTVNPSNDEGLDQLIQVVVSPLPLHWNDKVLGPYEFCSFANSVPKSGAIYEASTSRVYDNYRIFLESIDIRARGSSPDVADAVKRAEDPAYITVLKDNAGHTYSCPVYTFTPPLNELGSQSSRAKWDLGSEQYKSIESNTHARMQVGAFVRSSASSNLRVEENDVLRIVIEFNLGRILVQPGPWFSGTMIDLFRDGPFLAGSPLSSSWKFFGVDGRFQWLPREAIVAVQPKVTLVLSARAYNEFKEASHGIQSIDIGPFRFGEIGDESKMSFDEASKSLILESVRTTPFLIAVVNKAVGRR